MILAVRNRRVPQPGQDAKKLLCARVALVDGKPATGSLYRMEGALEKKKGFPSEVGEFVTKRCEEYCPFPAFVMDVAAVDGILKVVELNGINASGFYDSDIETIVKGIKSVMGR